MGSQYGIAGRWIANPEIYWNKNLITYHSFLIIRLTGVILATIAVSACKGQQLGGSFGDQVFEDLNGDGQIDLYPNDPYGPEPENILFRESNYRLNIAPPQPDPLAPGIARLNGYLPAASFMPGVQAVF